MLLTIDTDTTCVVETIDTLDVIANDLHSIAVNIHSFQVFIIVCIGVLITIGVCKLYNYVFRSLI